MKTAVIEKEKVTIKEIPDIKLKEKGAIIKTLGCGLCGSDIVKLKHNIAKEGTVLGHEVVGEIIELDSQTDFKIGDKIISAHHIPCFNCSYCKNENYSMCEHFKKTNIKPGGFSEYVFISEEHLQNIAYKIPESLTEIEASFYEPLGCCIRAVKRSGDCNNKTALVVGLGSIGILMAQALKAFGADVTACDIIEDRIKLANELGIKAIHSNQTKGLNVDKVFMTAGADVTIQLALDAVKDGGKIVVFASTPKNLGYANNEIYYRELTVMGSYSPSPADLKDSINLLAEKKVNVSNLSSIYKLDEINEAIHDTISNKILKAYIEISKADK